MPDIIQNMVGRWHQVIPFFGIDSKYLTGKHVPCPMCGGKDRYRFDNMGGRGTYFCSGCGSGDAMQLLTKFTGRTFKDIANEIRPMIGNVEAKIPEPVDKEKLKQSLIKTYKETFVSDKHLYLRSRGIQSNPDVRYHKSLPYYEEGKRTGEFPAMVAVIKNREGKAIGLHRTYLSYGKEKGFTRMKRKISPLLEDSNGCAIRLYECDEVLGVAEGIETACSVYELFNVPAWACVNTAILEKFDPPEKVKKLIIFGDHDKNYSGQKAAYALAKRLSEKLEVHVKIPDVTGSDWNDCLARKLGLKLK